MCECSFAFFHLQPHLEKCFSNIQRLDIVNLPRQPPTVLSMTSSEGEVISMPKSGLFSSLQLFAPIFVTNQYRRKRNQPSNLVEICVLEVLWSSGCALWNLECSTR